MKITNSVQRLGRKKAVPDFEKSVTPSRVRPWGTSLRVGLLALWIGLAGCVSKDILAQSTYREGDIIEDFTLVNRATGEPLRLSDFEGNIIFLEWFAWW